MSRNSLDSVTIRAEGEPETYHEVDFLVVADDQQPVVWFEGTRYDGAGVAEDVSVGDLFLDLTPEVTLRRVTDINESKPSHERGVTVEVVAGPLLNSGETRTDHTSIDQLTGDMDQGMPADPPPTLLDEV